MTNPPSINYTSDVVAEIVELVLQRLQQRTLETAPENLDNCTSQQPQPGTRITLSVSEAADLVGISKPTMYALIRSGEIPSVHARTKILIYRQAVIDWLSKGENNGEETC
ncbi:MAG: helix-turn-helix domain-containing protein [Firmicutes bacterium]|nr:helix-turn-helix domain-containing protein [Bacillota bacterium]